MNRHLLHRAFLKFALEIRPSIVVEQDGVRFRLRKNHYQLRRCLVFGWQKVFLNLSSLATPDTMFLDIGANVGIASLLVTKTRGCSSFAFEGVPSTFGELVENLSLNKDCAVVPFCCAVTDHNTIVTMTNTRSAGINRIISLETEQGRRVAGEEGEVSTPGVCLDTVYADFLQKQWSAPSPILVKIDVERGEESVLKGGGSFVGQQSAHDRVP